MPLSFSPWPEHQPTFAASSAHVLLFVCFWCSKSILVRNQDDMPRHTQQALKLARLQLPKGAVWAESRMADKSCLLKLSML